MGHAQGHFGSEFCIFYISYVKGIVNECLFVQGSVACNTQLDKQLGHEVEE